MANNGIVIGGVIASIAIVFAVFVSLNSMSENDGGELIVTNGNYAEENESALPPNNKWPVPGFMVRQE